MVRLATEHGLRVAPQATGHNAAPLAQRGLADVVLAERPLWPRSASTRSREWPGSAAAPSGTRPSPRPPHTDYHPARISPDVGIAGYSLTGGIGWYARKLGLATNSLTAIELVIADGTIVRADATTNPELFWALRGGGGNFGVVTALEFALFDIETAYAGMMILDISRAEEVLRRWATWAAAAPDEVTTRSASCTCRRCPSCRRSCSGRSVVVIDGAVLAATSGGSDPRELRALRPEIDTFRRVPTAGVHPAAHGSGGQCGPVVGSVMLAALPEGDRGLPDARRRPGHDHADVSELRQLGGALARPAATAASCRNSTGSSWPSAGMVINPEMACRPGRRAV